MEKVTAEVDDLVAGGQAQQLHRQVERGRAGVAHDPRRLPNSSATLASKSRTLRPIRCGLALEHVHDRADLALVVDAPA